MLSLFAPLPYNPQISDLRSVNEPLLRIRGEAVQAEQEQDGAIKHGLNALAPVPASALPPSDLIPPQRKGASCSGFVGWPSRQSRSGIALPRLRCVVGVCA